jgi:CRISPR type III-B/RAMP module-associated protein Cmr3
MSAGSWLAFTPRDTVFVRDGRSFNAAADTFGQTVRPGPTTLAGAVGAAFGKEPAEVRGPVLARRIGEAWVPYFPVPADLVRTADESGQVYRMTPRPAGRAVLDGPGAMSSWLMPPAHAEPVKRVTGWMPGRLLAEYLKGELPAPDGSPLAGLQVEESPLLPERRVGLARDGRSAREGFLYQAEHLRPREGWAFLAEYADGSTHLRLAGNHVPFGGKGRLADVEAADMSWPEPPTAIGARVLVYLATPVIWPDGWRIPVPDGARLIAAATREPEPAATVTPGPAWEDSRALRWAVPAGSVYLLEFTSADAGAQWARRWHGIAYGLDQADRLRTAGFGVVLTGVWT